MDFDAGYDEAFKRLKYVPLLPTSNIDIGWSQTHEDAKMERLLDENKTKNESFKKGVLQCILDCTRLQQSETRVRVQPPEVLDKCELCNTSMQPDIAKHLDMHFRMNVLEGFFTQSEDWRKQKKAAPQQRLLPRKVQNQLVQILQFPDLKAATRQRILMQLFPQHNSDEQIAQKNNPPPIKISRGWSMTSADWIKAKTCSVPADVIKYGRYVTSNNECFWRSLFPKEPIYDEWVSFLSNLNQKDALGAISKSLTILKASFNNKLASIRKHKKTKKPTLSQPVSKKLKSKVSQEKVFTNDPEDQRLCTICGERFCIVSIKDDNNNNDQEEGKKHFILQDAMCGGVEQQQTHVMHKQCFEATQK